jgi:single-stranded-DNA-specific exonuclease
VATPEARDRFLNPSLKDLHDPFLLDGMEQTVALLRAAIAEGKTITVYGDYDADGVCATSILLDLLHEEGASLAYRIPSRHEEGYGLNEQAVREVAARSSLLITVDCGISNFAEVSLAKSLGLTVIITDHHQPPENLPPADVVMDPLLGSYPFPSLCGAGVALKICQAMQGMEGLMKRLDLAAIATVADIVPLLDENRIIVREGLKYLENTPRPGLRALLRVSGAQPPLTAEHLAFRLGPRLNAVGRLGDAKLGVHLLLTPDPAKAEYIAGLMETSNRERQDLERSMTAEALMQLEALGVLSTPTTAPSVIPFPHVLIVSGEDWNPGLVGLTAGRLCERFHLPAIALSIRGEDAVGSCRSIPGVNIYRMLSACEDLLLRYGGHEQAAGLTVRAENIPALRDRLGQVISSSVPPECFIPSRDYDLAVPFRTWTPESLALLDQLEPTGCGNPPPLFRLENASVQSLRRVGLDGSHLKLSLLDPSGALIEGIAFGFGDIADSTPSSLDLLYRPTVNSFRGRTAIEAQIAAIRIEN